MTGVEATVHRALTLALQEIEEEHGLRVTDVQVEWRDTRTVGEPTTWRIIGLTVVTRSGE